VKNVEKTSMFAETPIDFSTWISTILFNKTIFIKMMSQIESVGDRYGNGGTTIHAGTSV
jgi:hypothetical protein